MSRIKRGGYVFLTWIGDHQPRHVHVYDDDRLILKWNLETDELLEGIPNRKIRRLIQGLIEEGRL